MNLEQIVRNKLKSVNERVYPVKYPQTATFPLIVYQRTARTPEYTHDGQSGFVESRFLISSFGLSYSDVHALPKAIRKAFADWEKSPVIVEGLYIGGTFLENEFDLHNPAGFEPQSTFQIVQEYLFAHHTED